MNAVKNQIVNASPVNPINQNNHSGFCPATKGDGVMRKLTNMFKLKNAVLATAAAVTGLIAVPQHSNAAIVTLQNGNSIVKLSTLSTDAGVPTNGVYQWAVDGTNVVAQQQFYYRVGNTGPGTEISSLSPSQIVPPVVTLSTTGSGPANYASVSYQGNGFTVNARYELLGGATGSDFSELIEQMIVTNVTSHTIQFHMVDYSDLNLSNPNGANDTGLATNNGATITQTGPNNALASPTYTGLQAVATTSMMPDEYEVDTGGTGSGALQSMLLSGAGFPLDDNAAANNQDVAFGEQYDQNIGVGGSLVFSVAEVISPTITVPEPAPASAAMLAAGSLFMMRPRRRDEDPDPRMAHVAGA
jgi:hypothetical protein